MKLRHAILSALLSIVPLVAQGAGFNAVLEGQSATAPSSHTATGVYITTSLLYWEELDTIPFRVRFSGGPATGKVVTVRFDHQKTLGTVTNFGIQNMTNFTPSAGVTITSGPTLDASDPDVWIYTFTIDMFGSAGDVQFVGNLSAGAHNFGGASLNVGGTPSLGNLSIQKPLAAPGTPNLSVTKTGPLTAVPGGTVTYTLTYTNVSALPVPSAATGVQLYDTLPAGLTYVPGSASCTGTCTGAPSVAGNEIVWNLGTIPLGASGSQTFQATVSPGATNGSTLVNRAIILSAENDAVPADNTSLFTTTVVATSTSLSVNNATATYGGTTTLEATLTDVAAGTGVSGKTITFSLNGTSVGSATTNGTGVATLSDVSVAGILVGTYPGAIEATFAGSAPYAGSSGTAQLQVTARPLTITANNQSKAYGDTFTFAGTEFTASDLVGTDTVASVSLSSTGSDPAAAAGVYDIVPSNAVGTGLDNYVITYANGVMTVGAKTLTITANNQSKTYGDVFTFAGTEFSVSGLTGTDTITAVTLTSSGAPAFAGAGSYDIVPSAATGTGLENYAISYVNGTLTVGAKLLTITANNQTKVYGDTFTFAGNEFSTSGLTGGDSVTAVTLVSAGAAAGAAAGSYDITPSAAIGTGLANYLITYSNGTLVVGARGLTITAKNQTKTYGTAFTFAGTEFTATGLTGGDTVASVSLSSPGAVAAAAVGSYEIVPSSAVGTGLGNYTITYANGTMTVEAKALVITANNQGKSYGDTFTFSGSEFTAVGLTGADAVTSVTLTSAGAAAAATVGTYDIVASAATGSGLANYSITYANGTLTVGARAVTVTADPKSKLYGEADPVLTYQITSGSLAAGDSFTGTLTREAGEDVGAYAINQGSLALNSNYALLFTGNNLTIDKRAITITADPKTKQYGTEDPALTYKITSGSLVNGDIIAGSLTRASGENVGKYQIQQGTIALSGNYTLTYVPANLTITRALLTVRANDKSRNYGEANPVFDATYTGFANGETLATSGVTGTPSLTTTATPASAVGSYPITASLGTLVSGNYSFTFVDGTLTVSGRAITVTADAKTKVYNTSDPTLTYQVTSGSLASGDTFTGALTREPGENVGTYAIQQGTLALNGNYALTFNGATFTITKADQTITFGALSNKKFGDPAFNVSATTTSGLPATFSVVSGPATISGSLVTITGSGLVAIRAEQAGNENYNAAAPVDQSFTVGKADQTISFAAIPNKTFGDPPVHMTVSASSSLPVDCAVVSGPGSMTTYYRVLIGGAGTITIRATQEGNENYNPAPPVEQSFVVAKANTVTGVTSTPNPSLLGEPVEFTAIISSAASGMTGSVQFRDNGANMGDPQPVAGNKAVLSISSLSIGEHAITAEYSGDNNFFGSTGALDGVNGENQIVQRPAALLNLATRLLVRTHDNVMIGGFIMTGIVPKKVIVRGLGPSLAEAGIQGFLADPFIELHGPDGSLLATNDNWKTQQQAEIEASGLAPKNDLESAIVATLPPAAYTVVIRGKNDMMGVGVVEVYDLDPLSESDLRNVSTRGYVADQEDVLIGGFTLGTHQGPVKILLKAHGICLKNWGLSDVLTDPVLHLHDANGTQLIANDNWKDDAQQAAAIEQSTIPPDNFLEAGAVIILQPGAYTVIVEGRDHAFGNGIVEVFPLN